MKRIVMCMALMLTSAVVMSQEVVPSSVTYTMENVPAGSIVAPATDTEIALGFQNVMDLANLKNNTRLSVLVDQHLDVRYGVYFPLAWYPKVNEYVSINPGYMFKDKTAATSMGQKEGVLFVTGFRLDNIFAHLSSSKPNIGFATLPPIEFGPYYSMKIISLKEIDHSYGVSVATKF